MAEHTTRPRVPAMLVAASELAVRVVIVGGAIFLAFIVLAKLRVVVLPLLLAFVLASVLEPPTTWLRHRGLPSLAATWLVVLAALSVLATLFYVAGSAVADEISQVGSALDQGWASIVEAARGSEIGARLTQSLENLPSQLGGSFGGTIVSGAVRVVEVVTMLILTLFYTFFFVKDGPDLVEWAMRHVGRGKRRATRSAGRDAWERVSRYIRGIALIATINSLLKGLALLLIGIPLILPLMLITFVGSFVPFVGPIVAGAAAALVALTTDEPLVNAALAAGAALVIQQFEGNVLEPLILGRVMRLHAIVIATAVAVGAIIGGIPGAFLAVPLVAATVTVWPHVRGYWDEHARPDAAGEDGAQERAA